MKRKLWIAGMTAVVLAVGAPRKAEAVRSAARATNACVGYTCRDQNGCDLGCNCRFVTRSDEGKCG